jgi:hypothetical protein
LPRRQEPAFDGRVSISSSPPPDAEKKKKYKIRWKRQHFNKLEITVFGGFFKQL